LEDERIIRKATDSGSETGRRIAERASASGESSSRTIISPGAGFDLPRLAIRVRECVRMVGEFKDAPRIRSLLKQLPARARDDKGKQFPEVI